MTNQIRRDKRAIIFGLALAITYFMGSLSVSHSAAWLQPQGQLEVHYEHVSSDYNQNFQGVENHYTRETEQIYFEYGYRDTLTLVGKYLSGQSGAGLGSEQDRTEIFEVAVRQKGGLKKGKLLPTGLAPLWKIMSPDPPLRQFHSSLDFGLGYSPSMEKAYTLIQYAVSDKIATTHQYPISVYTEIALNYQYYENGFQASKAITRVELAYRHFHVAYERLDGRFWGAYPYNEHLWFGEFGIPLNPQLKLIGKWGHERTLPGIPRETFIIFGVQVKRGASKH
ncbi:MAG: hypothetical protein ACON41_07280 [Parvibaculales bacterium]